MIASVLRLVLLGAAALASVATACGGDLPPELPTCGAPAAVHPTAIELGTYDGEAFHRFTDGDRAHIDDGYGMPLLVFRARVVGEQIPFCMEQSFTVHDEHGNVIGALTAALPSDEHGPAARLSVVDLVIPLDVTPRSGSSVVLAAGIGDAFITVELVSP